MTSLPSSFGTVMGQVSSSRSLSKRDRGCNLMLEWAESDSFREPRVRAIAVALKHIVQEASTNFEAKTESVVLQMTTESRPLAPGQMSACSRGMQTDLAEGTPPKEPPLHDHYRAIAAVRAICVVSKDPVLKFRCIQRLASTGLGGFLVNLLWVAFAVLYNTGTEDLNTGLVSHNDLSHGELVLKVKPLYHAVLECTVMCLGLAVILHRCPKALLWFSVWSFDSFALAINGLGFVVSAGLNRLSVGLKSGTMEPSYVAAQIVSSLFSYIPLVIIISYLDAFLFSRPVKLGITMISLIGLSFFYYRNRWTSFEWDEEEVCLWIHCASLRSMNLTTTVNFLVWNVKMIVAYLLGSDMAILRTEYKFADRQNEIQSMKEEEEIAELEAERALLRGFGASSEATSQTDARPCGPSVAIPVPSARSVGRLSTLEHFLGVFSTAMPQRSKLARSGERDLSAAPRKPASLAMQWSTKFVEDADLLAFSEALGAIVHDAALSLGHLDEQVVLLMSAIRRPRRHFHRMTRTQATQTHMDDVDSMHTRLSAEELSDRSREQLVSLLAQDGVLTVDSRPLVSTPFGAWLVRRKYWRFSIVLVLTLDAVLYFTSWEVLQTGLEASSVENGRAPLVIFVKPLWRILFEGVWFWVTMLLMLQRTYRGAFFMSLYCFDTWAMLLNGFLFAIVVCFNRIHHGVRSGAMSSELVVAQVVNTVLIHMPLFAVLATLDALVAPRRVKLCMLLIATVCYAMNFMQVRWVGNEWQEEDFCAWTHCTHLKNVALTTAFNHLVFILRALFTTAINSDFATIMASYRKVDSDRVGLTASLEKCAKALHCTSGAFVGSPRCGPVGEAVDSGTQTLDTDLSGLRMISQVGKLQSGDTSVDRHPSSSGTRSQRFKVTFDGAPAEPQPSEGQLLEAALDRAVV